VFLGYAGGNFYALDAANGGDAGPRGSINTARTAILGVEGGSGSQ
jgi:hypothetical protein